MRFDGKNNKRHATRMKIGELSGVTTGAHEGAKVTIMKFKNTDDFLKSVYSEMLTEEVTEDAVREHLEPMWQFNRALREAAEEILTNPEITDKQAALRESVAGYINSVLQLFNQPMEADNMAENKELEQVQSDLAKAQAEVETLTLISKMNDASKAHYESLSTDEAKAEFLKLSGEDQEAMVKMSQTQEETYTTVGGQTIVKSKAGDMFDVIKSQDEELRKSRENQAFAKAREEVGENIPNVPGEATAKVKAWQALEKLSAEEREYITTTLKAADALWKDRKAPAGEQGAGDELSADAKLEKLAKDAAAKDGTTFEVAYKKDRKSVV